MTTPKKLTLRLDPELRPAVEARAADARRSANAEVNYLVEFALSVLAKEKATTHTKG